MSKKNNQEQYKPIRWALLLSICALPLFLLGCSDSNSNGPSPAQAEDRAYYILPPGNYGGLPTTENSLDQLAAV